MAKVTEQDLQRVVDRINDRAGVKREAYTKESDGTYTLNPGVYMLAGAYGGWRLERSDGVTVTGYANKPETLRSLHTFLDGMRAAADELPGT